MWENLDVVARQDARSDRKPSRAELRSLILLVLAAAIAVVLPLLS